MMNVIKNEDIYQEFLEKFVAEVIFCNKTIMGLRWMNLKFTIVIYNSNLTIVKY